MKLEFKRTRKIYTSLRERYEQHYIRNGLIIATAVWLAIIYANLHFNNVICVNIPYYRATMYPLIAAIGGGLLGYLITALSILILIPGTPEINYLRSKGHFQTIITTYIEASAYISLATFFSLIGMVTNILSDIIFYIILFFIILSVIRVERCIWILYSVAKIFTRKEDSQAQVESIDQY